METMTKSKKHMTTKYDETKKSAKIMIVCIRSLTQNFKVILYQICHNCTRGLIIIIIIKIMSSTLASTNVEIRNIQHGK